MAVSSVHPVSLLKHREHSREQHDLAQMVNCNFYTTDPLLTAIMSLPNALEAAPIALEAAVREEEFSCLLGLRIVPDFAAGLAAGERPAPTNPERTGHQMQSYESDSRIH